MSGRSDGGDGGGDEGDGGDEGHGMDVDEDDAQAEDPSPSSGAGGNRVGFAQTTFLLCTIERAAPDSPTGMYIPLYEEMCSDPDASVYRMVHRGTHNFRHTQPVIPLHIQKSKSQNRDRPGTARELPRTASYF